MPPMNFNKELIFMKPNNKGTKKLIRGTAPAKVGVARRRRYVENAVVNSQPRSRRNFTGR